MSDLIDDLALQLECLYCHAEPGNWCTTKSGNIAQWLHGHRTYLPRHAYSVGYEEGWKDGVEITTRRMEREQAR